MKHKTTQGEAQGSNEITVAEYILALCLVEALLSGPQPDTDQSDLVVFTRLKCWGLR